MREQLEQRLKELQEEFESGQKMLADLDARREQVKQTLDRKPGRFLHAHRFIFMRE